MIATQENSKKFLENFTETFGAELLELFQDQTEPIAALLMQVIDIINYTQDLTRRNSKKIRIELERITEEVKSPTFKLVFLPFGEDGNCFFKRENCPFLFLTKDLDYARKVRKEFPNSIDKHLPPHAN